jgi:lipoprotein signal peptidase
VGVTFPFSRAVLWGCLTALKWMLWVTAMLLFAMAVIALMRSQGESPLRPLAFGIIVSGLGGFICARLARAMEGAG